MAKGVRYSVGFSIVFLLITAASGFSADLKITLNDIRLTPVYTDVPTETGTIRVVEGYHLYIRKKPDISSVLLTETTKDPDGVEANYAFRALNWNAINGDEIRYLDGKILSSPDSRYSIVDSTPEAHDELGVAFHLYIPRTMVYGYPWTRNGMVEIARGTFINIRAFGARYADYSNGFQDNPFMFDMSTVPAPPNPPRPAPVTPPPYEFPEPIVNYNPTPNYDPPEDYEDDPVDEYWDDNWDSEAYELEPEPMTPGEAILTDLYNSAAVDSFARISADTKGNIIYSRGIDTLIDDIASSLRMIDEKDQLDLVFVIDATGSMKNDIEKLRAELVPRLLMEFDAFRQVRLGLVLYRDYNDNFNERGLPIKIFPFFSRIDQFVAALNSFTIYGNEGGDVPEAVYEGLYGAMEYFPWAVKAKRKIILIGDAEPHPKPRLTRKYSHELITELAGIRFISVDSIVIPDERNQQHPSKTAVQ